MQREHYGNMCIVVIGLGGSGVTTLDFLEEAISVRSNCRDISCLAIDTDVIDTLIANLQRKHLTNIRETEQNNGNHTFSIIGSLTGGTTYANALAALREIEHFAAHDHVKANRTTVFDNSTFEKTTQNAYQHYREMYHTLTSGHRMTDSLYRCNMKRCNVPADENVPFFEQIHLYKDSREQFEPQTLICGSTRRGDNITRSYSSRPWITRRVLRAERNHQIDIFHLISDAGLIITAAQKTEDCINKSGKDICIMRCGYQGSRNTLSNGICAKTRIAAPIIQSRSPKYYMFSPKQEHESGIVQQCAIDAVA